jgi:hypothetical protein
MTFGEWACLAGGTRRAETRRSRRRDERAQRWDGAGKSNRLVSDRMKPSLERAIAGILGGLAHNANVLYFTKSESMLCYLDRRKRRGAATGRRAGRRVATRKAFRAQLHTRVAVRKDFFIWIRRNSLKNHESAKGIQGKSEPFSLDLFGFPCFDLAVTRPRLPPADERHLWSP